MADEEADVTVPSGEYVPETGFRSGALAARYSFSFDRVSSALVVSPDETALWSD